jgi:hypothetical protein
VGLTEMDTFQFDPRIPLRQYMRSADMLQRQAAIYTKEGKLETAFVYLTRLAKSGSLLVSFGSRGQS